MLKSLFILFLLVINTSCAIRSSTVVKKEHGIIDRLWLLERDLALVYMRPAMQLFKWRNITTNKMSDDIFLDRVKSINNYYNEWQIFIVKPGVYVLDYMYEYTPDCEMCTKFPGIRNGKVSYFSFEVEAGNAIYLGNFNLGYFIEARTNKVTEPEQAIQPNLFLKLTGDYNYSDEPQSIMLSTWSLSFKNKVNGVIAKVENDESKIDITSEVQKKFPNIKVNFQSIKPKFGISASDLNAYNVYYERGKKSAINGDISFLSAITLNFCKTSLEQNIYADKYNLYNIER